MNITASRRGPSLNNRVIPPQIISGLPLHQASMIAQESRLMNHQDENQSQSIYSNSFGAGGGGQTPGGASFHQGMGLAPITRTNTVSLNNNNHSHMTNQLRPNPNVYGVTGPLISSYQHNNIFMNDSAPSLFQIPGARTNSNQPNQRQNHGYFNNNQRTYGGDALDTFIQSQNQQALSSTHYAPVTQPGIGGGLFGGFGGNPANIIFPNSIYTRPHQYTATQGGGGGPSGFNRGLMNLNSTNNSLALAGAAILGANQQQQPTPLLARRVTTVSDFESHFLGNNNNSSQGGAAFANPYIGASRVRDEENDDDDAFSQGEAAFPPRIQMDSRLNHQVEDDEDDINNREYIEMERRERTESENERHLGHFQHLSQSNRNFVESLVDDILARNHQINQLHMAYSLASQRSNDNEQTTRGTNSAGSIQENQRNPIGQDINDIIDSQLEVLRQQQNILGINPHTIGDTAIIQPSGLSSSPYHDVPTHIKTDLDSQSSDEDDEDDDEDDEDDDQDDDNDDDSMTGPHPHQQHQQQQREEHHYHNRHEEEGLGGYYDEDEIDIDRLREQIFEHSQAAPYRELFRRSPSSGSNNARQSNNDQQRRNRRRTAVYGEEVEEEEEYNREEEYDEEEEEIGNATQLMIMREHHRRQMVAANLVDEEEDEEEAARDRANIIQEQDQQLEEDEDIQDDEEEHEDDMEDVGGVGGNDGVGPEDHLMGVLGQHHHHSQLEHVDDDECGGGAVNEGDGDESELERYLRDISQGINANRAKTAPLKAGKQQEHFKLTPGFSQLEQAAVCAVQLVQRGGGLGFGDMKFDLDSFEGQNSCKKFLSHLEKLCESVEAKCQNRQYRKKFSNAYKVLYKEGKLCYLTEILDSAQEAFPYLWVNGEKYVFSKEVIEAGRNLFNNFSKILYHVKDAYQRVCEENSYDALLDVISEIRQVLEDFDMNWVTYEQLYVIELMLIEQDARRYITEAIEVEKEITSAEVRERAKGKIMVDCPDYKKNRGKLIGIFNKINAVANPEGKGRDDLQAEILFTAESLCRRISSSQSKAVRKLAEEIRKSFQGIRGLLRKYEENIEGVDPQLKNNADLVAALVEFEQSWEKGKNYFVNEKKCAQLLHFTQIIEGTSEKYKGFQEQIEDRDTVIFVTIPALLILKNLDDGDDKGICRTFFPPMFGPQACIDDVDHGTAQNLSKEEKDMAFNKYQDLRAHYTKLRAGAKNAYDFYNFIEKCVLEMEDDDKCKANTDEVLKEQMGMTKEDFQKLVQQIRLLSMSLQRHKPAEWNEFLDVAL